jgi:hypothetical protein
MLTAPVRIFRSSDAASDLSDVSFHRQLPGKKRRRPSKYQDIVRTVSYVRKKCRRRIYGDNENPLRSKAQNKKETILWGTPWLTEKPEGFISISLGKRVRLMIRNCI